MSNFIIIENPFEDFLSFINKYVKGFHNSEPFKQLAEYQKNNQYVIAGTFAKYFDDLMDKEQNNLLDINGKSDLDSCFLLFNRMAEDNHSNGEKLLVDGIFDCLQIDKGYISLISNKLKGKSKILFEEWKKKQ